MRPIKTIARYALEWERNARLDPHFAILSLGRGLGGGWEESEFLQTGEQEVAELFSFFSSLGISIPKSSVCVDFGCGIGRVSQALASRFETTIGIDVSPTMIRLARERDHRPRYVLNQRDDLSCLGEASVDFIYSNLVLQHLNSTLQCRYIAEFGRIAKPGGIVAFQIPSHLPNGNFLKRIQRTTQGVTPSRLFALLGHCLRARVAPWQITLDATPMAEAEVVHRARIAGLFLLGLAYFDWRHTYSNLEMKLLNSKMREALPTHFPVSPLYVFRRGPTTNA